MLPLNRPTRRLLLVALFALLPHVARAVTLSNGSLTVDVRTNGAIDSVVFNAVDFFNGGAPVSDWGVQVEGVPATFAINTTAGVEQIPMDVKASYGSVVATGVYAAGGSNVQVRRVYRLVSGVNAVHVSTRFRNLSPAATTLLHFDTFDPDPGTTITHNDVFNLGGDLVAQSHTAGGLTVIVGALDAGAIVAAGGPLQINHPSLLAQHILSPVDGEGAASDSGMHVAFAIPLPGLSETTVEYVQAFGSSVAAAQSAYTSATRCGNGVIDSGELCDDDDKIDGDGCDSNCTPTGCGNGVVTGSEQCDSGAANGTGGEFCSATCQLAQLPPGFSARTVYRGGLISGVGGLVFDGDDALFVSDHVGSRLFKLDLTTEPPTFIPFLAGALHGPARMVIGDVPGPAGVELILADTNTDSSGNCCPGRVFRIDRTTIAWSTLNAPEGDPAGVALGPGGLFGTGLYISDFEGISPWAPEIARLNQDGSLITFAAPWGTDREPMHLEFSPGGAYGEYLYIVDGVAPATLWRADPAGAVTAFATTPALVNPMSLRWAAGAFGDEMFVLERNVSDTRIYSADAGGNLSPFASGLLLTNGIPDMAFHPSGQSLFVGLGSAIIEIYSTAVCGDGDIDPGEECDDGNALDGDCCSSTCDFEESGAPCGDDGLLCSTDVCDGAGVCIHPAGNAGTVCRPGSGDLCDPVEVCDGSSTQCPADAVQPTGTPCRSGSGDLCDPAEQCTGAPGQACPSDVVMPSGFVCRPGSGDVCDPSESCTGVSGAVCPSDSIASEGTLCRAATGPCDAEESCSGVTAESCPADAAMVDGTPCEDGSFCNGAETCDAGACVSGSPACSGQCDDSLDSCTSLCPPEPQSCRAASRAVLFVKDDPANDARDRFVWKWLKGSATGQADFGTPTSSTTHTVCVYEGPSAAFAFDVDIAPSSSLWKPIPEKGYRYSDPTTASEGVRRAVLRGGTEGKAKAIAVANGAGLPDPTLPLSTPVVVQLINDATGVCFGSVFDSSDLRPSPAGVLKALAD